MPKMGMNPIYSLLLILLDSNPIARLPKLRTSKMGMTSLVYWLVVIILVLIILYIVFRVF